MSLSRLVRNASMVCSPVRPRLWTRGLVRVASGIACSMRLMNSSTRARSLSLSAFRRCSMRCVRSRSESRTSPPPHPATPSATTTRIRMVGARTRRPYPDGPISTRREWPAQSEGQNRGGLDLDQRLGLDQREDLDDRHRREVAAHHLAVGGTDLALVGEIVLAIGDVP